MTDTSDPPMVLHERDARGVHRITLNHPASFNALSEAMLDALQAALDAVRADTQARAVVLGANGRAFCAGHHLKEMIAKPRADYYSELFARCTRMMMTVHKLPVPVIARVHALATAAGCQLVAQCDLAVASEDASFAVSGVKYGLFCATPSVPLVRNVPIKQAMEMLLTGDFITARQALEHGLVNRVAPAGELDAAIEALVSSILEKPALAVAMGKELVYRHREMGIEAAYQLAGQTMACNMMDASAQEGVLAFTEKRQPAWRKTD